MTPELLIAWSILLGALVVGWLVVRAVRGWRKQRPEPGPTAAEQVELFQQLHEDGELSAAELERIRARLTAGGQEQPPSAPPAPPDAIRPDRPG
jgi:hypothetical protein